MKRKNTKILIQHPHRENEISGVLTYVTLMAESLSTRPGIQVHTMSSKTTPRLEQIKRIWWADVVHLNSNDPLLVIAGRFMRKRVLLKAHYLFYQSLHHEYRPLSFLDRILDEIRFIGKTSGWFSKYARETYIRLMVRLVAVSIADEVLACSEFLNESLSLPRKVRTVYNPVSAQAISTMASPEIPVFIFLGRLNRDKGCDLLIEACSIIKMEGHEFRVVIVGDGEDLPKLKQLSVELGLSQHIEFRGRLSRNDAVSEINRAIALVQPARWQEPATYTPLEAASLGRVSIVAVTGGSMEMAGPMAFTFSRSDVSGLAFCLREVINNKEEAIARGSRALARVRREFSAEKITDEFLDLALRNR